MRVYPHHNTVGLISFTVLLALHIIAGFYDAQSSVYPSPQTMTAAFFQGPARLLFPVVVALICQPMLSRLIEERYIVSTRTRIDVRKLLTQNVIHACLKAGALFFIFGLTLSCIGYWIAPALFPDAISPTQYGLHSSDEILAESIQTAPLAGALNLSPLAFVAAISCWTSLTAIAFALATAIASLTINNSLVALIVPFIWFFGTSTVAQIAGLPEYSFTITTPYPYGLTNFKLVPAAIPMGVTFLIGIAGCTFIILRARHSGRFS